DEPHALYLRAPVRNPRDRFVLVSPTLTRRVLVIRIVPLAEYDAGRGRYRGARRADAVRLRVGLAVHARARFLRSAGFTVTHRVVGCGAPRERERCGHESRNKEN